MHESGTALATSQPTAAAGPAVEVIDLRRRYGGFAAVRGISFVVHAGEVLALLGVNGAGKTSARPGPSTGGVSKRPGAGPLPVMGDAIPLESPLMPHTTPSRLRELWAPCGHGTRTSRSKIKRHAVDLGIHRWGGWGSNPRPRDYESHALTG